MFGSNKKDSINFCSAQLKPAPGDLKSRLFEGRISNGPVFKWSGLSYTFSPNHSKIGPFKFPKFCLDFKMVFDKMAAICPDFKWFGFWISDPIRNPDDLQPNLFLIIPFEIQNSQDYRSPLYSQNIKKRSVVDPCKNYFWIAHHLVCHTDEANVNGAVALIWA